ncbi:hypothetical protein JXA80_09085 [bacterium]|nr:hypothetical protein [candidate division CSSED10-310 bacterium]
MIYLLTGPIHCGKTTALMEWISDSSRIGGFLCPDVDGKRMLFDIENRKFYPFETDDMTNGSCLRIGRFVFAQASFDIAMDILASAVIRQPHLFIIDEIGVLELENRGFAGMFENTLRAYRSHQFTGNLLIVVRDACLQNVIDHFGIHPHTVIGIDHLKGNVPWEYMERPSPRA